MADINNKKLAESPADKLAKMLGLDGMGGQIITGDEVKFHDGKELILPRGMTFESAFGILQRLHEDSETEIATTRQFKYRRNDGAHAAFQVIRERYGMVLGKSTWFEPAQAITVEVAPGQTMQLPWGNIEIPILEGTVITLCDQHHHRDYGAIFEMHAYGPKKHQVELEALFDAIELYLQEHSIYRGQAIIGSDNPEFLKLSLFDESQIVFSSDATTLLDGTIWAPIRFSETMRKEGVNLKRAALLFGPYGTGKSSAGLVTAKIAVANGWTFISAKPGRDNVIDVLRTARLYSPAVVFVEDIDNETSSGESDDVTQFLDAFDGITSKGGEIIAVMTTNHAERIHKGMLRPGRLDAVIEIAELDSASVERLAKVILPADKLAADLDWQAVGASLEGYLPAFVREAMDRVKLFAILHNDGREDYTIRTKDIVDAALSLKVQRQMLDDANEGERRPTLDVALSDAVEGAVKKLAVRRSDNGDVWPVIAQPEE